MIRADKKLDLKYKFKSLLKKRNPGKSIFIVATGRSGTHFLTNTLIQHPQITDLTGGKENPYVFPLVTQLATTNCNNKHLKSVLIKRYKRLKKMASPCHFLDQSHPNLWLAKFLVEKIESCRFLILIRNPYSVVYSMLEHKGVRKWVEEWEKLPIPNHFLGISEENVDRYKEMSILERSTFRWSSHYCQSRLLQDELGSLAHVCVYEDLCRKPGETLEEIQEFLCLKESIAIPEIAKESLNKYHKFDQNSLLKIKESMIEFLKINNYSFLDQDELIEKYQKLDV